MRKFMMAAAIALLPGTSLAGAYPNGPYPGWYSIVVEDMPGSGYNGVYGTLVGTIGDIPFSSEADCHAFADPTNKAAFAGGYHDRQIICVFVPKHS